MQYVQAAKAGPGDTADPGFLKLAAEEAELNRARERLTLKHRNSSRWARRALRRGQAVMDEGETLTSCGDEAQGHSDSSELRSCIARVWLCDD